jgi:uncharacterized LabA/DUF88 family protein
MNNRNKKDIKGKKEKNDKIENNYAFIDSQNLYQGIKNNRWEIDYGKFRLYLRNMYNVQKAFLFIGFVEGNSSLYRYLQDCGFILVFKPVLEIKKEGKTTYKGNVDAELVLHTMIEINNYNKAVIVSGDGDFFCLVEYLDSVNKLMKIFVPNLRYSSLLRKYSKHIVTMMKLRKKLAK